MEIGMEQFNQNILIIVIVTLDQMQPRGTKRDPTQPYICPTIITFHLFSLSWLSIVFLPLPGRTEYKWGRFILNQKWTTWISSIA